MLEFPTIAEALYRWEQFGKMPLDNTRQPIKIPSLPRRQLKGIFFRLLWMAGGAGRGLARMKHSRLVAVLNLHRISPQPNPFWSPLHPRLFEGLILYLKQNCRVSTLKDCWSGDDGRPTVVLSFDDGYHDFVEYAMPILVKHGLSVNQNIIPECVLSGLAPWNVRLYDFLNCAPLSLIKKIRVPGFRETLNDEHDGSKTRYGLALSRFLKLRPRSERAELWAFLEPIISQTASAGVRMMNMSDVAQAAMHHEIGVHSFGHESMAFEDDAFFEEDFERCFRFFEENLRLPLNIYAFPNGSYRPGQVETLRRKGLRHILLVNERMAREVDGSVLPRITIFGDTETEVRLRALGYGGATLL